jgi:hypothetical protein
MSRVPVPETLRARFDAADGALSAWTHVDWNPATGAVRTVLCKGCSVPIAAGRPDGDPTVVSVIEHPGTRTKTVLLEQRVITTRLGNHVTIVLRMDDGTTHTTHSCATCTGRLEDPAYLEALYLADVAQWLAEAEADPGDPGHYRRLFEVAATRRPVSGRIEEAR